MLMSSKKKERRKKERERGGREREKEREREREGGGGVAKGKRRKHNLKSHIVEVNLFKHSFEGMGEFNVMDVRLRTRFPLLWSTVKEKALAKGFSSSMRDAKYPCVC